MIDSLVHAPNSGTGLFELAAAAESAGLTVHRIDTGQHGQGFDVPAFVGLVGDGVAYRCPGGLLAAAMAAGAPIHLVGASAAWFAGLPVEFTGREWTLTDVAGVRDRLSRGPAFVKLAEAKHRGLPATRYRTVDAVDAALVGVQAPASLQLLATSGWLDLDSEYRVFTIGADVVAWSPYLVQDDPWTPLLRTHRASFHDEAAQFVRDLMEALPPSDVPPTAVIDVARLVDGRLVVLEVNHVWSSGLYGCDPSAVLEAVTVAADTTRDPPDRWVWRPDPAIRRLSPRI